MKWPFRNSKAGGDAFAGRPGGKGLQRKSWRMFRRNKLGMISLYVIIFLVNVAVFADFIAYNKPIVATYKGDTYFPIFGDYLNEVGLYSWDADLIHADWHDLELGFSIWPVVRYRPDDIDERFLKSTGPFAEQEIQTWKERHYLGTDDIGRDVLAGLIHGTRIALIIGLISMTIAGFIGIFFGACAGYFGDRHLKVRRANIIATVVGIIPAWFYGFFIRSEILGDTFAVGIFSFLFQVILSLIIFVAVLGVFNLMVWPVRKLPWFKQKLSVWIDIGLSRIIEIVVCLPSVLLIITIDSISSANPDHDRSGATLYLIMIVIGLTAWTGIARLMRGEMLRNRNMEYILAARSLGYSDIRIIFKHAVPNGLAPVFVTIAFGIAGAILVESALSFLGIGVSPDIVTWGSLLNRGRRSMDAWWLTVFPGLAVFVTVTVFNLFGEALRDALDPKSHQ